MINVSGYTYYGVNRKVTGLTSVKGSGGKGILINDNLLNVCTVEKCCEIDDYVLGITVRNELSDCKFALYCVYLPPENSKYGQNNEQVLNMLTVELFRHSELDDIFICGDFYARVGNLMENNYNCESKPHTVIDDYINSQGHKLINFCGDVDCSLVNGRITPKMDDFTSVTAHRGRAVVDYHIIRSENIRHVHSMKVVSCVELIDQLKIAHLLGNYCHIPDHNLLTMEVEMSVILREEKSGCNQCSAKF